MLALHGLLLFAHGARDVQWAAPFEAVAAQVKTRCPGTPVELAFLEFMLPTLAQASARLVDAGCNYIHVVPLFLGAGGHVRKDLPRLIDELRAQSPAVRWRLAPAIGENDAMVDAMASVAIATLNVV
jgi:sirohydrochlorin cobaltochelatase